MRDFFRLQELILTTRLSRGGEALVPAAIVGLGYNRQREAGQTVAGVRCTREEGPDSTEQGDG